ncbi:hypothetical protein J6590_054210 [Homalodisca vitripennis]|nr:hypothetical protein J6590_054210 [Homalodisca vitripennis]
MTAESCLAWDNVESPNANVVRAYKRLYDEMVWIKVHRGSIFVRYTEDITATNTLNKSSREFSSRSVNTEAKRD